MANRTTGPGTKRPVDTAPHQIELDPEIDISDTRQFAGMDRVDCGIEAYPEFTFYWGTSRKGYPIPKVKADSSRLRGKLVALNEWPKAVHSRYSLKQFWAVFCAKVRGHLRYYGVSFNIRALSVFVYQAVRVAYKWLNRRSQRRSFTWETFRAFIKRHRLPRRAVYHALY
jgi:RNA-directed DNA polymerase